MLAFGHNGVGTMVGLGTFAVLPDSIPLPGRLGIAFVLGIFSHYLTDAIPHGHYEFAPHELTKKMALLFLADFGGSMLILAGIALWRFGLTEGFFMVFAGMWGAQLPDIFEGFVSLKVIPSWRWVRAHRKFHFETMHAKTPHNLLLPDGVSRRWSWTDIWQIGCFVGSIYICI